MKEERNHKQYSGIYTLYFWIHDNNFLLKQQEKKKECQKEIVKHLLEEGRKV